MTWEEHAFLTKGFSPNSATDSLCDLGSLTRAPSASSSVWGGGADRDTRGERLAQSFAQCRCSVSGPDLSQEECTCRLPVCYCRLSLGVWSRLNSGVRSLVFTLVSVCQVLCWALDLFSRVMLSGVSFHYFFLEMKVFPRHSFGWCSR